MKKSLRIITVAATIGVALLVSTSAQAFFGPFGGGPWRWWDGGYGPWGGYPYYGYPYYGYPHYGGWGYPYGYGYPAYGVPVYGYPYAAPAAPASSGSSE